MRDATIFLAGMAWGVAVVQFCLIARRVWALRNGSSCDNCLGHGPESCPVCNGSDEGGGA